MPTFRYKAASSGGEVFEGEVEAISKRDALNQLRSQGHIPIRIEEGAVKKGRFLGIPYQVARKKASISQKQIGVITQEIAGLLRAGLPLDRAMEILITVAEDEKVRGVLVSVQEKVRGGSSLADALDAQDGVFSRFYVNMIRAGEAGGSLETVLDRLNEYLARARALHETVSSALIYPIILLCVAGGSVIVLLTYVVPQFKQLFEDAGQDLPISTQVVIAAGNILQNYWWALILTGMAIFFYMRNQFAHEKSRLRWDFRLLRLPMVGDLIAKVEMARFSRGLSTLLGNGVPMLTALAIVKEILENRVLCKEVGRVAERLKEGKGLADPMMASGLFPKLAVHMIRVGEESGRLEDMLEDVATAYDNEVQSAVKKMLALMEPLLILGLGVVIAGIIMSILVAIMGINDLAI